MNLMQGTISDRQRISPRKLAPVVFLAALALAEALWLRVHPLVFSGTEPVFWTTLVLLGISWIYGSSGRSLALSEMSFYAALWIVTALIGAILTYLFASLNLPLLDARFTRLDQALGFNWRAFYDFVQQHPLLRALLTLAYYSGLLQVFFSIIYLSHSGRSDRNEELWWASSIALMLTALLSGLLPAGGTLFFHSIGLENAVHLPHFMALRDESLREFAFGDLKGIVTFPPITRPSPCCSSTPTVSSGFFAGCLH